MQIPESHGCHRDRLLGVVVTSAAALDLSWCSAEAAMAAGPAVAVLLLADSMDVPRSAEAATRMIVLVCCPSHRME
jgi:hypothetical protein